MPAAIFRQIKRAILNGCRGAHLLDAAFNSEWRRRRLAILCYHGTALEDEHLWDSSLYVSAAHLERRFELIKRSGCTVLPLDIALQKLWSGTLPERSIAITVDDGTYDFYRMMWPLLRAFNYPATLYWTTYYSDLRRPVFRLICSYMLWKRREYEIRPGAAFPVDQPLPLAGADTRNAIVDTLDQHAATAKLSGEEKDDLARELASQIGIDYNQLLEKRILQLISRDEAAELSAAGIDLQIHTHRHRTPHEREAFAREIEDNRVRIEQVTGTSAGHFCYPSGVHEPEFLPWLQEQNIVSATTCESGVASPSSHPLLLPRIVDHMHLSEVEFEAWLAGVGIGPRRHRPGLNG